MKIAVLGSGNGGCAVAADCALHGNTVSIFDFEAFNQNTIAIAKAGGIEATGKVEGFAPVIYAGSDIKKAVEGAELVYVVGPSYAQTAFANAYRSVMEPGQQVVICPGTNGGALLFKKQIGLAYNDPSIVVAETSTLPYACRVLSPGTVHVYHKLPDGVFLSALPSSGRHDVFTSYASVFPGTRLSDNVFQTILQNGNNVIHPAISLVNTGRIESKEDFLFYEQGVTPAGGRLMQAVDRERMAIAEALGLDVMSEPHTGVVQEYMTEENYDTGYSKAPGFKGILAQTQIDYRYFTEDVGYGLVLLTDMARHVNVETPVMDAIIQVVSVLLEEDYKREAKRTLASFGLDGLAKKELLAQVA